MPLLDYSFIGSDPEEEEDPAAYPTADPVEEEKPKILDYSFIGDSNLEKVGERTSAILLGGATGAAEIVTSQEEPTISSVAKDIAEGKEDNMFGLPNIPMALLNAASSGIAKGITDVVDYFTEGDIREDVKDVNRDISSEAKAILGDPSMQYTGNPAQKLGFEVLEGAAVMGPAFIASWGTRNPNIMLSAIGAQVAGNTYNDWMEKTGGDKDRTMAAVKFNVLAEVIPEMIPATAWLSKTAGPALHRFIEGTLGEGVQEGLTQILQDTYDKVELEEMSLKDALLNIDWGNVGHAALIGVGVGGILTTPATVSDIVSKKPTDSDPNVPSDNNPDQTPILFKETHTINGIPVQQATKRGEILTNTYVDKDQNVYRPSAENTVVQTAELNLAQDVDAVAEKIKAEVNATDQVDPDALVGETLMPTFETEDSSQLFSEMEPDLSQPIEFDAVEDVAMSDTDASQLFTDVMGEDISYADDRAIEAGKAATSPENNLAEPTDGQKSAGNYQKAHPTVQGFNIAIENPQGSRRKPEWPELTADYGYIKRTVGADSETGAAPHEVEQVDVFVKHDVDIPADNPVYIVDQVNKDGSFDETKVMMGYESTEAASEGYFSNYTKGWDRVNAVTEATPEQLKEWLNDPAANDEYAEYLKGTPKKLKPVAKAAPKTEIEPPPAPAATETETAETKPAVGEVVAQPPIKKPAAKKAPFDTKDMVARKDDKQEYVYHATFTNKAKKIQKGGLKPLQTSNWTKPSWTNAKGEAPTRYNEDGGVFAFERAEDAARWAFKMGYEFNEATSIIKAKRDGSWEVDPSEDIALQSGKGKSLKRRGAVPAEDIISSTSAEIPSIAESGMTGNEYIEKLSAELESEEAPLNPNEMLARHDESAPQAIDSDPYMDFRGRELQYQVKVESTGKVATLSVDAATAMEEADARVESLEELRRCI